MGLACVCLCFIPVISQISLDPAKDRNQSNITRKYALRPSIRVTVKYAYLWGFVSFSALLYISFFPDFQILSK